MPEVTTRSPATSSHAATTTLGGRSLAMWVVMGGSVKPTASTTPMSSAHSAGLNTSWTVRIGNPAPTSEQIRSLIARMAENQHRNDRAMEEFEREEIRPSFRIGFSIDDLEESSFEAELAFLVGIISRHIHFVRCGHVAVSWIKRHG